MRRIALFILMLIVALIFCSCAATESLPGTLSEVSPKNTDDVVDEDVATGSAETLSAPYSFTSFEDFETHEKKLGTKALSHYYTPSALTQDYELSQITKRDDVYVMLEYTLSQNKVISAEKLSEYDAERLSTLICRYSLYSDGEKALKESFINKGYKAIEHEGKVYYRWDEHAENNPDKRIIGYEIAFLADGKLIFMHLPAVDTFENMMKYANVIKVNINQ